MNISKIQDQIRDYIAQDKLKEAIELLRRHVNTDELLNNVIMQSATYNEIKKLINKGVISFEQTKIPKANIRNSLLQLASELENDQTLRDDKRKSISIAFLVFFSLFIVSILLLYIYLGFIEKKENDSSVDVNEDSFIADKVNNEGTVAIEETNDTVSLIIEDVIVLNTGAGIDPSKKNVVENLLDKQTKLPIIKGQVLDENDKGIVDAIIVTPDGSEIKTNKFGLFSLTLEKPEEEYPSKIYLYYFKDSLESKSLISVGQKNITLRF